MQSTNPDVRALAEQCVALLQSATGPFDEEALREALSHLVSVVSPSSRDASSPRAIVRTREAAGRRAGQQSKSVALPALSSHSTFSSSRNSGGGALSPTSGGSMPTPPSSPPTKGRSGSVWSAASSPQVERKSASPTPTLGRHKSQDVSGSAAIVVAQIPGTETPPLSRNEQSEREGLAKLENARLLLSKSKEVEIKARDGALCSSCRVRRLLQPCTECWEGQCADVACAGLYTLKSLGETQKRLICKRCIEKLKSRALASRAETHDGKARLPAMADQPPVVTGVVAASSPPAAPPSGEADNPMFLAAQMRRRPAGPAGRTEASDDEPTNPMFNRRRGKEPDEQTAVDQDDPFDDFSWTGVSDEEEDSD